MFRAYFAQTDIEILIGNILVKEQSRFGVLMRRQNQYGVEHLLLCDCDPEDKEASSLPYEYWDFIVPPLATHLRAANTLEGDALGVIEWLRQKDTDLSEKESRYLTLFEQAVRHYRTPAVH